MPEAELFTETHAGVQFSDGLANIEIGSVETLDPSIFAQPLWMEIEVNGEVLTPRQKLLGSPYAMTLVGGAVVGSTHDNTDPDYGTLTIVAGSSGNALIVGTTGDGDYIRACDNIIDSRDCPTLAFQLKNDGSIFTRADTVIGVSANDMVPNPDFSNVTLFPGGNNRVTIRPNSVGSHYLYVPVDTPITLLGTPLKISNVRVCYDLSLATTYINDTSVEMALDNGAVTTLIDNVTNQTSTSWTCYISSVSPAADLTGPIMVRFFVTAGGTGAAHELTIGKITLTLTED